MVSLIDMAPTVLAIAGIEPPDYMQGRIIIGPKEEKAPDVIFATRDRMDEVHDMSRAVRGKRHKYIKNFFPERPYSTPITSPSMSCFWTIGTSSSTTRRTPRQATEVRRSQHHETSGTAPTSSCWRPCPRIHD